MIVEGSLRLGEGLSEAKAAQWLGVSRTPVREAFARLEIEGLVVSEPQRRTRVFMPGPKDVDDICVVRGCLESRALVLAMERRRVELKASLAEWVRQMEEALRSQDLSEYLRLDSKFHQSIFDHADNVFLCDAYQTIAPKLAALRTRLAMHLDYLKKGYGEHLRLSELIASGDVVSALKILEEHISRKEDSFWRLDDGLVDLDRRRTRRAQRGDDKIFATTSDSPQENRRDWTPAAAVSATQGHKGEGRSAKAVDESGASKSIDENGLKTPVDEKRRGRPRIHPDGAARKRTWAAREREKERTQRLILGQSPPKRGRPRKALHRSEPHGADPDAKD
jgi:DNA-binding GntR family transcriptional regulator